jgi:hypothetical protein
MEDISRLPNTLTIPETMNMLKISRARIYVLAQTGRLEIKRNGRYSYVDVGSIDEFSKHRQVWLDALDAPKKPRKKWYVPTGRPRGRPRKSPVELVQDTH